MRFRKGTKVEVLTQKEVPSGSWRCAEIIGGNGHNYSVRYDGDMRVFGEALVERVSRKAIRPCPTSMDVLEDWVPGDVVEVLHNFSWKMATILKDLGRTHILVRLLGSAIEIKANKHDVRPRLCWLDGEWIVIGKASSKYEDLKIRLPCSRKENVISQKVDTILRLRIKCSHNAMKDNKTILESQSIPVRTLKRKQSDLRSQAEVDAGCSQKIRVGKKENIWRPIDLIQRPQSPQKVDELGENFMNPSLINQINGYHEMISERVKTDCVGCSRSMSLELDSDDDSVSSSVGSCSVYRNYPHTLHYVRAACRVEDNESQGSYDESFCRSKPVEGNFLPPNDSLTEEIHRLELHAYHCIIEAFHASGPLSWEQELLLSNLRGSLHISNDEHLMEIRSLVSSSSCIPCCQ